MSDNEVNRENVAKAYVLGYQRNGIDCRVLKSREVPAKDNHGPGWEYDFVLGKPMHSEEFGGTFKLFTKYDVLGQLDMSIQFFKHEFFTWKRKHDEIESNIIEVPAIVVSPGESIEDAIRKSGILKG